MTHNFQTCGRGFANVAREARRFLGLARTTDGKTGRSVLSASDIHTILDNTDDPAHAFESVALALLEIVRDCSAEVTFPEDPPRPTT